MDLKLEDNLYIIQIDGTTLVMSKEDFIKSLKLGKWWRKKQGHAPLHAMMEARTDEARQQGPNGMQRTRKP